MIGSARRWLEQPGMPAQRFACNQYRDRAVTPRIGDFDRSPGMNRVSCAVELRPRVVFLRFMVVHQHDLARCIDFGVVVVSVLGGGNPVSGEHHRRG